MSNKRPSFQFYPGDWQRDAALRGCSLGAKGLWIEMICIMHQAVPYGYFLVNQKSPSRLTSLRLFGCTPDEYDAYLKELEDSGVFSKDANGTIFSRRMVDDEKLRKVRTDAGYKGGNPNLKPKNLVNQKSTTLVNQKSTPSSSSSSSSAKQKKGNPNGLPKEKFPPWLPIEEWENFLQHRKEVKAPMTKLAQQRAIAMLQKFREEGDDPAAVLAQSILHGWKGIFRLKAKYETPTERMKRICGGHENGRTIDAEVVTDALD